MKRGVKFAASLGCVVSVAGPVGALILYPKAKWLFSLVLIGLLVLWLNHLLAEDRTPRALADQIEGLLKGEYDGWTVDDFEHQSIRDPRLRDLHRRAMELGGLPERWATSSSETKNQLREIIVELRKLDDAENKKNVTKSIS